MKSKKQKGRGSLVSRVSLCFFTFILIFSFLFPISAYAKEISLYSMQFKFGQNFTFGSNYEPLFTGTTYQSNAGKKNISFLNSNQVLVNSPIMLTVDWYTNQEKEFTITKGQYINVNTVFWENSRILNISDAVVSVSNGTETKDLHVGYPSFNHSTGECSFSVQAPFDFTTDTFYITFVIGFRNDFGNTYFKITSLDLDTGSNTDHLLSNLKDFLSNILQSILTGIQNLPTAFTNAINQIQSWLSSLGTLLNDKLTSVSSQIRNKIQSMTDSVEQFFLDLTDNISEFFTDLVDNIKSLFVPSSAWQESNKERWQTWSQARFGALIQVRDFMSSIYTSFAPLFNNNLRDDIDITFPAIKLPRSVFGGGSDKVLLSATHFSFYNNPFFTETIVSQTENK